MAYGCIGCFKTPEAKSERSLSVMTWNLNGLTRHKIPFLIRMMQQDNIDVLVGIDCRHSPSSAKSYKKVFKQGLGAGTSCYFSVDPSRQHSEPGGISFIVGPKWGTSVIHDESRTDRSGHGVLARVRLRTTSGFLSVHGPCSPYKPSPAHMSEGSKNLWNNV